MPDPFNRRALIAGLGAAGAAAAIGPGAAGWAMQRAAAASSSGPRPLPARMRGINLEISPGSLLPSHVRELADWGVNTVRINFSTDLINNTAKDTTVVRPSRADPLAPYRVNLELLQAFTAECGKAGIGVMLAANYLYGRQDADLEDYTGKSFKDSLGASLSSFWSAIARELRDDPAIFAYDVLNEPSYNYRRPEDGAVWYEQMMPDAIRRIRAVNPNIWIAVMPWPWGFPTQFDEIPLIDDPAIIYSFHIYTPKNYTHQGVGQPRSGATYPGSLRQFDSEPIEYWDKAALEATMRKAFDFAKTNNVRMMASEFGVARWAPGRERYIADLLSLFEANGIDWLFHTYNTWNGWNPSFRPDAPETSAHPTLYGGYNSPTHQLLRRHWRMNGR